MQFAKSILRVGVGLSLVYSFSLGAESGAFIGVEAGLLHSKFDDVKDNVGDFGFKAGYRFNPNHRIYGAYHYTTKASDSEYYSNILLQSDAKVQKFLVGYDFTPEIATNTRAVVGVYGGIARLDLDVVGSYNGVSASISDSASDFIYGGKLGALYEMGVGEIEGGLKAERVSYGVEGSSDLKQTNLGIFIGYNYKF